MAENRATHTIDPEHADPRATPTYLVGGVGIALFVVVVLLLEVVYHRTVEAENHRKVVAEQPQELRALEAAQREQLTTYRLVDPARGIVAIPIDRAIDLVVEEARSGAPARPPAGAAAR